MTWDKPQRPQYVELTAQTRQKRLPPFPVLHNVPRHKRELALSLLCALTHEGRKRAEKGTEHVEALVAWDCGKRGLQDISEALQAMVEGVRGYGGYCDVPIRFLKAAIELEIASPDEAIKWGVP